MVQPGAERSEQEDALLASLATQYPNWDVHHIRADYIAVPKGTQVIQALTAALMKDKLAPHRET
jgi:hypothetical protein